MNTSSQKIHACILCGGNSQRFNSSSSSSSNSNSNFQATTNQPKFLAQLAGYSAIWHACLQFRLNRAVNGKIIIVCRQEYQEQIQKTLELDDQQAQSLCQDIAKLTTVTCAPVAGNTRAASSLAGAKYLQAQLEVQAEDWLVVHDGARACLSSKLLNQLITTLNQPNTKHGAMCVSAITDTIKDISTTLRTLNREQLLAAITPQAFKIDQLITMLNKYPNVTDEAQAFENEKLFPVPVLMDADDTNLKITHQQDLTITEAIIKTRQELKHLLLP